MNVHETTVIALGILLVAIPVGLTLATTIYENKVNKKEQEKHHCECHECCGCQCCVEREEECGCCGKPLSECQCNCSCHNH